jgi:hypothetical protein
LNKVGKALPVLRGWMEEREAPEKSNERFLGTWSIKEEGT